MSSDTRPEIIDCFSGRRHPGGFVSALLAPALPWLAIYAGAAAILLFFVFPAAANAYSIRQTDGDFTGIISLSPTKFELQMEPGETSNNEVTVINGAAEGISLDFFTEDFEGSKDPNQALVYLGDEISDWGAREWIEPEVDGIFLEPGESITMNVTISVPGDADAGGRYAAISVTPAEDQDGGDGSTSAPPTVRCLFLLTVAGGVAENASLAAPEPPGLFDSGRAPIGLVFNNLGEVHLKPSGKIKITNMLGQDAAELKVPEWVVLPDASRRTSVEWETGPTTFGRYTAIAEIGFGADGTMLTASSSFWIFPWDTLAVIAVILAAVLVVVVLLRRRSRTPAAAEPDQAGEFEPEETQESSAAPTSELEAPAVEAPEPPAAPPSEVAEPTAPPARETDRVPLSELFPSMDDSRLIDLSDDDTQKLVRDLVGDQIDLARLHLSEGASELGREVLKEARVAASRARLYSLVGEIDDLLWRS